MEIIKFLKRLHGLGIVADERLWSVSEAESCWPLRHLVLAHLTNHVLRATNPQHRLAAASQRRKDVSYPGGAGAGDFRGWNLAFAWFCTSHST